MDEYKIYQINKFNDDVAQGIVAIFYNKDLAEEYLSYQASIGNCYDCKGPLNAEKSALKTISITADFEDMQPDIRPGDLIKIEPDVPTSEKDFTLVMVGDQILCRRIKRYVSGVFLIPGNAAFSPEFYSMEELEQKGFKILGKVVECVRNY